MQFSVLMSLYIKEKPEYLHECLLSLSKQTLNADEIVLVYDGPITKELENVVSSWLELLPIKIVKLDENVGLGQALNEGLAHCMYNIVARMDTDDICHPERFKRQIDFLSKNNEVAIVGSYIEEFDGTPNNILYKRKVPTDHYCILERIKMQNPFSHMTVMFHKDAILNVGGYKHHFLMEDYNLWLRLMTSNIKAANLPLVLVFVRSGDAMINRRGGWQYVISEYELAKIKYNLGYQKCFSAIGYFILRSAPRFFPTSLLKIIYGLIRKR